MLETRPSVAFLKPLDADAAAPYPAAVCRLVSACVAFDFGLDAAALESIERGSQRVAIARQIAMYLSHVGFGLNFETVGQAFGRDRTTVAHACRVVEDGRDDIWFDCRIATLESICSKSIGRNAR